jgi:L-alanine-DL-glutamate epimerase-like enolase superfamily enzyme
LAKPARSRCIGYGGQQREGACLRCLVQPSTPEERARLASEQANEGWKAIKLRLHHASLKEDLRTMEAVQKVVGDRMDIMVDANRAQSSGNWQPAVLWDFGEPWPRLASCNS